jgi:hypothetical protein
MVAGSVPWLFVGSEENRRLGGGNDQGIRARTWAAATGEEERKRMASRVIAQDRYNRSALQYHESNVGARSRKTRISASSGTPHAP